jgi:6-pyruvoyltetrahydropterin/6-carboxytetrahydropterin synthase
MTTCTKVLRFCAGHRLMGHESGCAHLHGHNYRAEITARATAGLDPVGRVVDFSVIKAKVGDWIDIHWDHGFLVCEQDTATIDLLIAFAGIAKVPQRIVRLPQNPTAENLAAALLEQSARLLRADGVDVVRVRLWETPTCYADVTTP